MGQERGATTGPGRSTEMEPNELGRLLHEMFGTDYDSTLKDTMPLIDKVRGDAGIDKEEDDALWENALAAFGEEGQEVFKPIQIDPSEALKDELHNSFMYRVMATAAMQKSSDLVLFFLKLREKHLAEISGYKGQIQALNSDLLRAEQWRADCRIAGEGLNNAKSILLPLYEAMTQGGADDSNLHAEQVFEAYAEINDALRMLAYVYRKRYFEDPAGETPMPEMTREQRDRERAEQAQAEAEVKLQRPTRSKRGSGKKLGRPPGRKTGRPSTKTTATKKTAAKQTATKKPASKRSAKTAAKTAAKPTRKKTSRAK